MCSVSLPCLRHKVQRHFVCNFSTWNPHQRNARLSSQTSSPTNLSIENCAGKCGAAVVPIPGWHDNFSKSYEGGTENAHIDLSPRPLRDGRWG
jgi:hypothetical protein